ncbi:MAG: lysozyme inhibitor LprI family protein [Hyphomicrobiales bacterium]
MRARIAIISAAALIGAATFALAGGQSEPEKNCDGNTYEIVECLKAKTAEWDKRMTIAYQQALKDAEPKQREQLRVAQRLWIQYRDANCLYYGLGEGTIARIEAGYCMKELTQTRALELESKTEKH